MSQVRIAFNANDSWRSLAALSEHLDPLRSAHKLQVDLSDCQYLGPLAVAYLSAMVIERDAASHTTTFTRPKLPRVYNYCVFSGFADLAHFGPAAAPDPRNETIPLRHLGGRDLDSALAVAAMINKHSRMTSHGEQVLTTMIGEINQNVADHAQGPGVLSARYQSGRDVVRVAIADVGVGLKESLAADSHAHAMELALMRGHSGATQPHNAGQGLDLLHQLVENDGGQLVLASGDACFHAHKSQSCTHRLNTTISGTIVFFEFNGRPDTYPDDLFSDDIW